MTACEIMGIIGVDYVCKECPKLVMLGACIDI